VADSISELHASCHRFLRAALRDKVFHQLAFKLGCFGHHSARALLLQVAKEGKGNLLSDRIILTAAVVRNRVDLSRHPRFGNQIIMKDLITNPVPSLYTFGYYWRWKTLYLTFKEVFFFSVRRVYLARKD